MYIRYFIFFALLFSTGCPQNVQPSNSSNYPQKFIMPYLKSNMKPASENFRLEQEEMAAAGRNLWTEQPRPESSRRFMTWNVYGGKNSSDHFDIASQINVIEKIAPDVLALQEDIPHGIWEHLNKSQYTAIHFGLADGHLGNALAIRNTCQLLGHITVIPLPRGPKQAAEKRNALSARLRVGNSHIRVITTHLDVWDNTGATRLAQLAAIHVYLTSLPADDHTLVVFMGDLNALDKQLLDKFDHAFPHLQLRIKTEQQDRERGITTPTPYEEIAFIRQSMGFSEVYNLLNIFGPWSTSKFGRRIDYIFLKGEKERLQNAYVYFTAASDHLPVVADIHAS